MTKNENLDTLRAIAVVLRPYIFDTYDLLTAADAVMQVTVLKPDPATHAGRVSIALASPVVTQYLLDHQRINAIKELRRLTECGLKEAKDAIEDKAVTSIYPVRTY